MASDRGNITLSADDLNLEQAFPPLSGHRQSTRGLKMKVTKVLVGLAVLIGLVRIGEEGGIGFIEDFAPAKARTIPLRQLIPGTEDYYFHALHYLNTVQFDKAEALTKPWHD